MFDILNYPQIENHLRNISQIFKMTKSDEIQIHCPFCDDSTRPNHSHHGHLYISTTQAVFNCFRCNSSGTLLKLLIETNFEDQEILQLLSKRIKYNFKKDYFRTKIKKIDIRKNIDNYILDIIKNNLDFFLYFQQYLFYRLGENIDFKEFLITPDFLYNQPCCNFYNIDGELIISRYIKPISKYRFKLNNKSSGLYFFQEPDFDKYTDIVLAEGPFDILNLYLYNYQFRNSIFYSISGKKYLSTIERLIFQDLLIGEYNFHLIFDKDNFSFKKILYHSKKLCENLNENIKVQGYQPLIGKDTGDYPAVLEV